MYKQLAGELVRKEWESRLQNDPQASPKPEIGLHLFRYHPVHLAGLLEAAWEARFRPTSRPNSPLRGLPRTLLDLVAIERPDHYGNYEVETKVVPDHLIYAYMIENTRIYEIFRRVLWEFVHGERFGAPSEETQQWLRTTEELFYRDTPSFFAFQLTSHVRPDVRAARRNAYYRMFGMDLSHGTEDGRPYPYEKPADANRAFVPTFEEFLREVWRGIVNVTNTSGPRTTDKWAIAELAGRLSDMLKVRRRKGVLAREEFFYVATMAWLHLTVEFDGSPVVVDLKAEGENAAERLRKIGERVGLPAHSRATDFFSLADPMSRLLIAIESGVFDKPANVKPLYAEGSPLQEDIGEIITSWSSATGRSVKADPVLASPAARQIPPPPAVPIVPAHNGAVPALMSRT